MRPVRFLALLTALVALAATFDASRDGLDSLQRARVNAAEALAVGERSLATTPGVREVEGPADWLSLRQLGGLNTVAPTASQLAAIGAQATAVQRQTRRSAPAIASRTWH